MLYIDFVKIYVGISEMFYKCVYVCMFVHIHTNMNLFKGTCAK